MASLVKDVIKKCSKPDYRSGQARIEDSGSKDADYQTGKFPKHFWHASCVDLNQRHLTHFSLMSMNGSK